MKLDEFSTRHLIKSIRIALASEKNNLITRAKEAKSQLKKRNISKKIKKVDESYNRCNALETLLDNIERFRYEIQEEKLNNLVNLGTCMSSELFSDIKISLDKDISNYNLNIKVNSKKTLIDCLKKILKEIKNSKLEYVGIINKDTYLYCKMDDIIKEILYREEEYLKSSCIPLSVITGYKKTFEMPEYFKILTNHVDGKNAFYDSNAVSNDKKMLDILNDFNKIEKSIIERERLEFTEKNLSSLIDELKKEKCDFSKSIVFLSKLYKKNLSKLKKEEKFLDQFDIDYVKKFVKEDSEKAHLQNGLSSYKNILKELEQAKQNKDQTKIKELEERRQQTVSHYNINEANQMLLDIEAKKEFSEDSRSKENERKVLLESQKRPDYDGIAKDYVRYLSSLKNKKEAMTFSDFAKEKHNVVANEFMVSESFREDLKTRNK